MSSLEDQVVEVSEEENDEKKVRQEPAAELEPQEGLTAWLVVIGAFLTNFCSFGTFYSFSVFVTTYVEQFEVDRASISVIYQLQVAVFMGGGVVTGRLADTYGVRPIYTFGTLMMGLGFLLASYAATFAQAVVTHGLMVGIGMSCVYWPASSVVPQWFDKRRGFAVGMAVLGSGVGNFVGAIALEPLLQEQGLGFALRVLAVTCFTLQMLASLLVKRRLPNIGRRPVFADIGLFKDRNFLILMLGGFFFQIGYVIPFSAGSPFAEELGFGTSFAAFTVSMIGIGSAVGRIGLGFVADQIGRIRTFKLAMGGSGLTCALWWFSQTEPALLSWSFFFGFFTGGWIAIIPLVVGAFFGLDKLGSTMGLISLSLVPSSILGPFLGGKLYDVTGSYRLTAIVTGVTVCLAGFATFLLDNPEAASNELTIDTDDAEATVPKKETSSPDEEHSVSSESVSKDEAKEHSPESGDEGVKIRIEEEEHVVPTNTPGSEDENSEAGEDGNTGNVN